MQLSSSSIRVETLVDILLILMRDDSLQPGLDNDINLAKIFQIVTAQGNHRANHLLRLVLSRLACLQEGFCRAQEVVLVLGCNEDSFGNSPSVLLVTSFKCP